MLNAGEVRVNNGRNRDAVADANRLKGQDPDNLGTRWKIHGIHFGADCLGSSGRLFANEL